MADSMPAWKAKAIDIVRKEVLAWEQPIFWIVPKVAFNMRLLIEQLIKNYWGVFDEPVDPTSGKEKIWMHLTRTMVESQVEDTIIKSKDVNFRAKTDIAIPYKPLVKNIVKNHLDKIYFGDKLRDLVRDMGMTGTAVWKMHPDFGDKLLRRVSVLNCYIDPSVDSIQDAERFTERAVQTIDEIKGMKSWEDTGKLAGSNQVHRQDSVVSGANTSPEGLKFAEVFETWGKIPKWVLNKEDKGDDYDMEEGQIVCSRDNGTWNFHFLKKNTTKDSTGRIIKPYEEAWFSKIPGRWHGVGPPETLLHLQIWSNISANIYVNREFISSLGLFQIRKGSGITPQMISKLAANGAIQVSQIDQDIKQIQMDEPGPAFYNNQQFIYEQAQKWTRTFEIAGADDMPASTPATIGVIKNQSAQTASSLVKEGTGIFLQRCLGRHLMPNIFKDIKIGDIIHATGDTSMLQALDDAIVFDLLAKQLDEMEAKGVIVTPEKVELEEQRIRQFYQKQGNQRIIKYLKNLDWAEYDVEPFITNEDFDKGTMTQNLLTALQIAPEYKDQILKELFDLMNLPPLKAPTQMQGTMAAPQQQPMMNPTERMAQNNTMEQGAAVGRPIGGVNVR